MAASAGTVTLELDANSVRLLRDLLKTERATKRSANNMQRSMKKAFAQIRTAAFSLGGAFAGINLVGFARSAVNAGVKMEAFQRSLRVATGSADAARREMGFLIETSKSLGLNLETTAGSYSKLAAAAKGTALQGRETRQIFLAISEASTVLGLSAEQTGGALTAIEQIISKGKVSAEELRGQLGERLPGAFQIAARAIGKTTAELDEMLKKGELTAEQLLPELARELRDTFGPEVEASAKSAQAAFERLSTALFQLKVAIADSGLLDAIAELSNKIAGTISPTTEQRIVQIRRQIELLKQSFREAGGIGEPTAALKELRQELIELLKVQSIAANAIDRVNPTKAILSLAATDQELTKFFEKQNKALEKLRKNFVREFETAEQQVARRLQEFSVVEHMFPEEERARIKDVIRSTLTDGIEEIVITTKRRFTKPMKKEFDEIEAASEQAARNIQTSFAEFLFDPFEDGIKGMVRGFLDAIRRMLANQAAIQLFGFLKDFINPAQTLSLIDLSTLPQRRALGGPVAAGVPHIVGERGSELFIPNESGVVVPNHKLGMGGFNNINNITVNGAEPERAAQLIEVAAEEGSNRAVARILDLRSRRSF